MLQSSVWSQLARVKPSLMYIGNRTIMSAKTYGPMKTLLNGVSEEINLLKQTKHWNDNGKRSLAVAVVLLSRGKVIAVPTDTVYGLAGIVADTNSIKRLYEIKKRDEKKPLCISVSNVNDIGNWGVIDHLPPEFLSSILPGPYTVILKRTPALNPALNPGIDTVGIRVPQFKFINCISELVGPLALTSANRSNEPSCVSPTEFEELWPELDGIFHIQKKTCQTKYSRKESTIVDLSSPGYYEIVRFGAAAGPLIRILNKYNIKPYDTVSEPYSASLSGSNSN